MRAFRKLTWLEVKLLCRDPLTAVFTFAFPLMMLLVLAEVFGNSTADRAERVYRDVGAIDFYVPAYVGLAAAAVGLVSVPVHLASYRESGVLRRFRASGLGAWTVAGAEVAVALLLTAGGAVLVVVPGAVLYGNRLPAGAGAVIGAVAVALLVALAFAAIGLLLGAVLPNPRAAQGAGSILFFTMMLLSGTGPPPEVLTGPMAALAAVLPLTPAVRLLQDPWLGFAWEWRPFLAVVAVLVVAGGLAVRTFRWE